MTAIAYQKHDVGNKQFVIEWVLDPTQSGGEVGEVFEARDARLVTIHALCDNGQESKLKLSNFAEAIGTPSLAMTVALPDHVIMPYEPTEIPMPPPMRYYWTQVEEVAMVGPARIALLFEAL